MNPQNFAVSDVNWDKGDGLLPTVIQDSISMRVLMLGFMNLEALQQTLSTERVTFFSRTKNRLWTKGESSGNFLKLVSVRLDCDADSFLIMAEPFGHTCHKGTRSCFGDEREMNFTVLSDLESVVKDRKNHPKKDSYTTSLFESGMKRMAQKVGEEGVEVALAALSEPMRLTDEVADLLYHLTVLLSASDKSWVDIMNLLYQRSQKKT